MPLVEDLLPPPTCIAYITLLIRHNHKAIKYPPQTFCKGLCRVWQCVCFLTPAENFRGRCSDDRAELFQKALKELECVMEGECACVCVVWCGVVWVCTWIGDLGGCGCVRMWVWLLLGSLS